MSQEDKHHNAGPDDDDNSEEVRASESIPWYDRPSAVSVIIAVLAFLVFQVLPPELQQSLRRQVDRLAGEWRLALESYDIAATPELTLSRVIPHDPASFTQVCTSHAANIFVFPAPSTLPYHATFKPLPPLPLR
jgi:hypothetical protein